MKRIIQFALLSIVIISIIIFNKIYFSGTKKTVVETTVVETADQTNQIIQKTDNNIIKSLKYEVKLEQDNWYIITSNLSELTYINDAELIKMQGVIAKFIDENNMPLIIRSDEALYNNANYNTKFRKNVRIDYMNHKIFSDKIDINFQDNTVKIFDNVKYVGLDGTINSDNIVLNLITKKVDIYMNNEKENIEITKK